MISVDTFNMEQITMIWTILFGLAVGSFLNVVIYRLPRKMSFLLDRSICTSCKSQLKWYHNIPVLSYLFLRGKCQFCSEKISFRYPLIEILNALSYGYFLYAFGLSLDFYIYSLLSSALLVIFFIDLDFQIIPDRINYPLMIIGLGISFLPDGIGIKNSIIGLLVGGGSLYLVALLGDFLFKKDSMGGGDIKMVAMLGAFLGWQKVLFIFISSAVIGLVVSLVIMAFSSKLRQSRMIPFGPFLSLAAMLAIVYGDELIGLYLSTFVYTN